MPPVLYLHLLEQKTISLHSLMLSLLVRAVTRQMTGELKLLTRSFSFIQV